MGPKGIDGALPECHAETLTFSRIDVLSNPVPWIQVDEIVCLYGPRVGASSEQTPGFDCRYEVLYSQNFLEVSITMWRNDLLSGIACANLACREIQHCESTCFKDLMHLQSCSSQYVMWIHSHFLS